MLACCLTAAAQCVKVCWSRLVMLTDDTSLLHLHYISVQTAPGGAFHLWVELISSESSYKTTATSLPRKVRSQLWWLVTAVVRCSVKVFLSSSLLPPTEAKEGI